MKKKRKIRIDRLLILIIPVVLIIGLIIFFLTVNIKFIGKKSVNANAKKIQTKEVLVFYPNTKQGKIYANEIAKRTEKDEIVDYKLTKFGDYYLVEYQDGVSYFIDANQTKDLEVSTINNNATYILSDYLRYQMKKEEKDIAYTLSFLEETYYLNLDITKCKYSINGLNLEVYFPQYEETVVIPITNTQELLNINLGIDSRYVKPRYISNNRKVISFTFDDGPNVSDKKGATSKQMVETLYKYDSSATFFLIGSNIVTDPNSSLYCFDFLKDAVGKGMEYGSHTQNHYNLRNCDSDTIVEEINIPYNDLKTGIGYEMKLYRPPYGARNEYVDSYAPLTAICWNVDSEDWRFRLSYSGDECVNKIKEKVINETDDNDVILFHDIYQTSVDAACELLEYFINEGYQVVNASELMEVLDVTNVKYFYGK